MGLANTETILPQGDLLDAFIARWQGRLGGQERANYAMFLRELCSALGVPPPDPSGDPEANVCVFDGVVGKHDFFKQHRAV
jgi:hypothetical protein